MRTPAATDLSRAAFAALRRAALIARAHGAALEIVHVVPAPPRSAAWDELRAAFSGVETDLRRSVAENLDGIVVVGAHGENLTTPLLGSVSLDVVTQADCDVLLARTAAS
jgi:nucleotide-binding universal stress UspA family protein